MNETNNISLNIFESIKNTNLNTEREIKKENFEKKVKSSQQQLISSNDLNDLYIMSSDESENKICIPSSLVSRKISKSLLNQKDKIKEE